MELPLLLQAQVQPAQLVTIPLPPELTQVWAVIVDMAADFKALRQTVEQIGVHVMEMHQRVDHLIGILGNIQTDIGEAKQQVQDLIALLKAPDVALQAKVEQAISMAEAIDAGMEDIVTQPTEPPVEPTLEPEPQP